jgi:hypothetical protein
MSTVSERVALGEKFMDENDPGWWRADVERAIDLAELNMGYGYACVLGQRCPFETLTAWLGGDLEEDDDEEFRYHAYAGKLSGIPRFQREALQDWAVAHGFNRPMGGSNAEYAELTAEWSRVITERRAAA